MTDAELMDISESIVTWCRERDLKVSEVVRVAVIVAAHGIAKVCTDRIELAKTIDLACSAIRQQAAEAYNVHRQLQ